VEILFVKFGEGEGEYSVQEKQSIINYSRKYGGSKSVMDK